MEIVKTPSLGGIQAERRLLPVPVQKTEAQSLPQESLILTGGADGPRDNGSQVVAQKGLDQPTSPVHNPGSRVTTDNAPGVIAMLEPGPSVAVSSNSRDTKFVAKYGPWGVVTGASQGVGAEMARQLAEKGLNVVLVARSGDKLAAVAEQLRRDTGVQVQVVSADLSQNEGLQKLKAETSDLEVGLLINNAGAWQFGSFLGNDIERDRQIVALNVEAPMVLAHHFAGSMVQRGRGGIINVGSGAALHGVPGQATYSATKGFLRNLTESLHHELKGKGVDVLITNPGPIQGDASSIYDQSKVPLPKVDAETVTADAFKQLGRTSHTIPGWMNKLGMTVALKLMPRDMLASIAGYVLERATPAEAPAVQKASPSAEVQETQSKVSTAPQALKKTSEAAAKNAAGGVLGHLWGAVTALAQPVKTLFSTAKFAMGFVGDMRTRAEEITRDPGKVEEQLKTAGLHHEYSPPKNHADVKIEGKMLIKANMEEFFELWNSWIQKGYGSINDRQYADLVLKFRDQAKELPLLAHIPMTSEDVFSAEVKNGLMTSMKETTTTRLGGLIPTSTVEWQYQRTSEPRASNSFEKKIDDFNGDIGKVQAFYQDLFDPKHVNPNSKASVTFVVQEVEEIDKPEGGGQQEFVHSVNVPMGGLLPKPESTLTGPTKAS